MSSKAQLVISRVIEEAGDEAEGATLYCVDMPNSVCADAIAEAGIKRVVYGGDCATSPPLDAASIQVDWLQR